MIRPMNDTKAIINIFGFLIMNNYRNSESIEDLLRSFDTASRRIEFKYRNAVLGQVVNGLNKSDSIELNIEHGRQALVRLETQ